MVKRQDEMVEKVVNSKYVEAEFEEEDWSNENVNIYFNKNFDEVNEMVVDCGAPKILIGEKYWKEYLKEHSLENEDLEKSPLQSKI